MSIGLPAACKASARPSKFIPMSTTPELNSCITSLPWAHHLRICSLILSRLWNARSMSKGVELIHGDPVGDQRLLPRALCAALAALQRTYPRKLAVIPEFRPVCGSRRAWRMHLGIYRQDEPGLNAFDTPRRACRQA